MDTIIERINALSTEQLIEATLFFIEITEPEHNNEEGLSLRDEIAIEPDKHLAELKKICRVILFNAVEKESFQKVVSDAIENTGKKNLAFSGVDLAILVSGVIAVLRIVVNPISSEKKSFYDENGKRVSVEKKYNNDTSFLTDIFKSLFKGKKE